MKKTGLYLCATLLLPALLAACSGGGANALPLASAGIAQIVNEKTTVNLDGRDSSDMGGKIAGYAWTQVSGEKVVLANAATATPSFTAPLVTNLEGSKVLVFKLVVTDNQGATAEDTVKVTISAVNEGAVGAISAGNNQSVLEGAVVKLGGVAGGQEGDLTYKWEQIGGAAVKLTGDTTLTPSFTAPVASGSNSTLIFSLTVSGTQGIIAMDTVTVSVGISNKNPVANAGSDLEATENVVVKLSGSGTDPNGDTLTYSWLQTTGKAVLLSGGNTATPSFTAPQVAGTDNLTFSLTVNDGHGGISTDTVNVVVKNKPNAAPIAKAGVDLSVNEKAPVSLSGSGSDEDGTIASYAWTQTSGATVTLTGANTATLSFTAPVVNTAEASRILSFKLTVTDNQGKTAEDTVSVVVKAVNESPTANISGIQPVLEGATVSLVGTATDPDGDTLTYSWVQSSSTPTPAIVPNGAATLTPSFTAPEVTTPNATTTLTFTLTVSDGRTTGTASINVVVKDNPVIQPGPLDKLGKLNDTGITLCGDTSGNGDCPKAGYPGQDAQVGRDADQSTSTNNDADGRRGFNFTKIGADGKALVIQNQAWSNTGLETAGSKWSCVKDNVTGLIWEVKTADGGSHDKGGTYIWSATTTYVTTVNNAGWCGVNSDWRLPTVNELQSIADLSSKNPAIAIDSGYFPNTVPALYWSATPYSSTENLGINFVQGKAVPAAHSTGYSVRLVRSQ